MSRAVARTSAILFDRERVEHLDDLPEQPERLNGSTLLWLIRFPTKRRVIVTRPRSTAIGSRNVVIAAPRIVMR